ncbi:MAG TPA: FemAB family XrtA/PEP-CTERM system-associated protein [Allosphingosinicella sp.]
MNAFSPVAALAVRVADSRDRAAVAEFIAEHPAATPFHRLEWLEAIERGCGQRAHILVAENESGVAGLLPLIEIRSPLFGSALVSTGFGVGGGVLGGCVEPLAEAAVALASRSGCESVELRGGTVPHGWQPKTGIYANFARSLPGEDEAILKAIPRKQRAEVRRALGFDLEVRTGRDRRDLADHYRVYSESVRNLGTPVFPRRLFEAMLDSFGEEADILTVSRAGRPIASVLSFYMSGTVYPYWGGGTSEARSWRANDLLYYELMRNAARRGCTRFDFGRSKLGTGAFAFKKNWGFEPEPLTYAVHGEAREVNPLSPKYRLQTALWRKLPLPLANRLGPPIAKGLG